VGAGCEPLNANPALRKVSMDHDPDGGGSRSFLSPLLERALPVESGIARGLATGGALGVAEAGLFFAGQANFIHRSLGFVLAPTALVLLYGILGGLVGATALGRRLRFGLVYLAGALVLAKLYAGAALLVNWWFLPPLLVLSLVVARFGVRLDGEAARRVASIGRWLLLAPVVAVVAVALFGGESPTTGVRPRPEPASGGTNVLLVTWDTVRSDTLPLFGGGGLDTPELDRLAAEGVSFDAFQAVAPLTGPAHASLLTGLYPPRHGLRANGEALVGGRGLPELLGGEGFATAAFVAGYPLRSDFGFGRGFQTFDDRPAAGALRRVVAFVCSTSRVLRRTMPKSLRSGSSYIPGEAVTARALRWLDGVDRPFFLWTHYFDAHNPYEPPEPFRGRALARAEEGPHALDPACEENVVLQRGQIERLDGFLGELRRALEEDGRWDDTLVVLVADHGECFGEGGIVNAHEPSLFAATQRVLCVLRPDAADRDGAWSPGARLTGVASQVDLLPTLCGLLGLEPPAEAEGIDLASLEAGRGAYMEAFQTRLGDDRLQGWVEGGWKFVRSLGGERRLYRTGLGPSGAGEEEVSLGDEPGIATRLEGLLDAYLEALPETAEGEGRALSEDDVEALRDLGYGGEE